MEKYFKYSSAELYKEIIKSDEILSNYLIRLIWSRNDSNSYIQDLLKRASPKIKSSVLRLMPPGKASSHLSFLSNLLEKEELKNRRIIVDKLDGVKDPKAISVLLRCVKNEHEDPLLKKKAITSLGNLADETVVDELIKHFEKSDNDTRINILIAFSKIGSAKVVPVLRRLAYHHNSTIRFWTFKAMQAFPEYLDLKDIIQIFRREENQDNQAVLISILGRINRLEALEFLIELYLEYNKSSLRYDLLNSFEKIDIERARDIFYKKRKNAGSKNTREAIDEALNYLSRSYRSELVNYKSIYKRWVRIPLSYPDKSEISFFKDGKAVYQELKAGEIELKRNFRFVVKNENITFLSELGQEITTTYKIEDGVFNLPYERAVPCFILKYSNHEIYIGGTNITGTSYYYLKEFI